MFKLEYQNIFTQVQVQGPPEMGMDPTGTIARERTKGASFNTLAGLFGNAQLGPIYLGPFGLVSLATGFIWFFIVGMSYWAQVDYSPGLFFRELFWLSLEPPADLAGLCHQLVDPHLPAGRGIGSGQARLLGLCFCDLAVPGSGSHSTRADGQLVRGGALRCLQPP